MVLLPDKLFGSTAMTIHLIDTDLQRKIVDSNDLDTEAMKAVEFLLGNGPANLQKDLEDWTTQKFEGKDVLFYQGRNYIPKNYELRWEIVSQFHDKVSAGHPGEIETLNAIKEHYWWPGMRSFIKNYVKGCGICQQFKINRNPSNPLYIPIPGTHKYKTFC